MQAEGRAIDSAQLRALLRAYLLLSFRTVILLRGRRGSPSSLGYVLLMYGSLGLFTGLAALAHPAVFVFSVGLHSITFVVVSMAALIEANEILFDRRQEEILFPLPIHPSTLLLAKALTLIAFALIPGLALNFVSTILGLAAADARPWFPLVHLVSVVLLTTFACATVVCVYGIVLRLFGRERFENLAVFAQVGMVVLYVGGFQIVPRLFEGKSRGTVAEAARWLLPTPPGWFAAFDGWLAGRSAGAEITAFAALAVLAPAVLGWFALTRLSAGFAEKAQPTEDVRPKRTESEPVAKPTWQSKNPLLRSWVRDPIEWGAFRLAAAYIRRDREIKLRVYSLMALFAVFGILSIVDTRRNLLFVPLTISYSVVAAMGAMDALQSSSHFAAAQVFASTPIASTAPLFHGVRKACILFVQTPLLLVSLFLLAFLSDRMDNVKLALPIAALAPTVTLIPGALGAYLPLSKPPHAGEQSARRSILIGSTMLVLLAVGYGAPRLGHFSVLLPAEVCLVAAAHVWLRRKIAKQPLPPIAES
jgi:hypothetical protein